MCKHIELLISVIFPLHFLLLNLSLLSIYLSIYLSSISLNEETKLSQDSYLLSSRLKHRPLHSETHIVSSSLSLSLSPTSKGERESSTSSTCRGEAHHSMRKRSLFSARKTKDLSWKEEEQLLLVFTIKRCLPLEEKKNERKRERLLQIDKFSFVHKRTRRH